MCRNGFRGDGAYGQFCLVLPEHDAVLAMTAETTQMQEVLDAVWEHLLPGFDAAGSAAADTELSARLAGAAIDPPSDDGSGRDTADLARSGGDGAPSGESVRIEATESGWVAEFAEGRRSWRLPIDNGSWAAGDWRGDAGLPFRSAGGWSDGVFRAELRMIQTPHVIRLVADPAAGTVELAWRQPPLHGLDPAEHSISTR
jgi:hypothetical protein